MRRKASQAVLGLAAALSRLSESSAAATPATAGWPQPTHTQLRAASVVLAACAGLAKELGLAASDAARIAAAVQLVLRASPQAIAAGWAAITDSSEVADRQELAGLLAAHSAAYAAAVHAALDLVRAQRSEVAAFAASIGPGVLLPFLRAMAHTVLALPGELDEDDEGEEQPRLYVCV